MIALANCMTWLVSKQHAETMQMPVTVVSSKGFITAAWGITWDDNYAAVRQVTCGVQGDAEQGPHMMAAWGSRGLGPLPVKLAFTGGQNGWATGPPAAMGALAGLV